MLILYLGADIAIDLCLTAWLITSATFDIAFNVCYYAYPSSPKSNIPMLAAGCLEAVAALLHFILFVLACVSVHKWRKESERVLKDLEKMGGRQVNFSHRYEIVDEC